MFESYGSETLIMFFDPAPEIVRLWGNKRNMRCAQDGKMFHSHVEANRD